MERADSYVVSTNYMLKYSAQTDIGLKRSNNEDSIDVCRNKIGDILFLVADGMGGHNAGEVASEMIREIITSAFKKIDDKQVDYQKFLYDIIKEANTEVYRQSLVEVSQNNMGTTISVMIMQGDRIFVGHVGDSRIYYMTDKRVELLTKDHTLVQAMLDAETITQDEADHSPYKNVLLQALGTTKNITLHQMSAKIPKQCHFILCSDGLTGAVSSNEIWQIMTSGYELEERVQMLIQLANNRGGGDNVSVIGIDRDERG